MGNRYTRSPNIMRKILYGFNTQAYTILLYDYEKRWKNYDTQKWNSALDSLQNRKTIERSFATDKLHVSTSRFVPPEPAPADTPKADEFAEIEVVLRENKYRQYVANGGQKAANETAEAIPVNYVGGYLAFYRTGHKVISATNIIMNDADKIDTVLPEQLKMGDFVVVRETAKDLIREMADVILARSGKAGLREMAGKWKEALEIETLFYSDVIAPQSRQDLEHIASATGSGVLKELLDQIYDAAQTVRSAHIQAGRVLSMHLRSRIVEALKGHVDIDPFNIWEPIEMQVEGIGTVRILKIIDIGAPVTVDIADTNRLIDEE